MPEAPTRSTSYETDGNGGVLGSTTPRLWTPPLRDLGTKECPNYDATYGWDVIDFARDVLGMPLDPWQEWIVVHAGELLEDGRPRFRKVLVLVARQNGKTHLLRVLALYWMFIERLKLIVGTSTNRDTAKETWQAAIDLAEDNDYLSEEIAKIVGNNGAESFNTTSGCRYRIVASNRRGPRGWTVYRLILDELREHASWDAWNAAAPTIKTVAVGQIWCISNQGDDQAVVLDALRTPAIAYIETGQGDWRLGLFEYSSPDGSDPTDVRALAQANPGLGIRIEVDDIMGDAITAKMAGGEQLAGFKTENMCMRVPLLDPAIDPGRWGLAGVDDPPDLALHRRMVALCLDLSLDGTHASLVAAARVGDKIHIDPVRSWAGTDVGQQLRRDLPALVARIKPRMFGWIPNGPAAAVAVDLRTKQRGEVAWPPPGVKVAEIKAEIPQICMGLAEIVQSGGVSHPRDEALDIQIQTTQKLKRGDTWVFQRGGVSPIDGSYATAGAVHLARGMRARAPLSMAVAGQDQR